MKPMSGSPDYDSDELIARARAGDQAAWGELFDKCYPKVIRAVRHKLNRPMRSLYDSSDFVSDVMKSLAANINRRDFPSLRSLINYLAQAAQTKVIDEYRRLHTIKRDITRECTPVTCNGTDYGPMVLASPDPTASQVAQADEAHERLMAGQDDLERRVIELKRLGYTNAEIAELTGWELRKVQRFFKKLHDSLRKDGDES